MTIKEKNQIIEALTKELNETTNFYLTDIGGLTVERTGELRRLCFKRDVRLKVVKNTLLRIAMEKSEKELEGLYETLVGPNSIMFTETGNVPAKLIKEFRSKHKSEKPLLKGAYVEESFYVGADHLDALENIKSKNEVIGDIITLLQSPAKNVISALQSSGQQLSGILETLSERPE